MDMAAETISIEEAADRLGVHYMTIYRYVRLGRLPADRVGGRWRIRPKDLALVSPSIIGAAARTRHRGEGKRGADSLAKASRRLRDRLVAGDAGGAWLIVESALLAGTPSDVYLQLLGPCLRMIGDEWERGRISIADEHRATAVALGVVGRLSPLFGRRGRRRPGLVLLAGAEGDSHSIPLAMVADHVRAEGLDVIHLGADVPVDTVVTMAAAVDVSAVGLSASTPPGVVNASRAVDELHRLRPGVPVMLGGPAVPNAKAALRAGADGWAPDGASAAELFLSHKRVGRPA
jgi:MerR family transcriptional regulator, light-induced transcriptional regulator